MSDDNVIHQLDEVLEAAKGNWLHVLAVISPNLIDAVERVGRHVTDPVNGTSNAAGKGDGFRLFDNAAETGGGVSNRDGTFASGLSLLEWSTGSSKYDLINEIGDVLGCQGKPAQSGVRRSSSKSVSTTLATRIAEATERSKAQSIAQEKRKKKAAESNERLWQSCTPITDAVPTPIFDYVNNRGMKHMAMMYKHDHIRYHDALPYYQEVDGKIQIVGRHPAMVAAIRDVFGSVIALHRTYLTFDGAKADVEMARKMTTLSRDFTPSAAIQLGGLSDEIGIAEGIETAWAAMSVYQLPVWARVTSSLLPSFRPPARVRKVHIFADKDRSNDGQSKGARLRDALLASGVDAELHIPEGQIRDAAKSLDFAEVLDRFGAGAFPSIDLIGRRSVA
ncbi:toprim domain-containing protein [uncultured Umboniibacter sp.]|uniref:DUF7146 domain-containing protein n=1 Tax=uncultured Umboniibacter sp. TaxID=1798917 RepID=UPI002610A929|nr:toprim domain-containing protein [uncultured Umboniibacter sp.]